MSANPASEGQVTGAVSLNPAEKHTLQKQKRIQRITNEHFFRAHPELKVMVSSFISALLKEKPEDAALFAENYFTQPDLARQLGYIGWTRPPTPEPEYEEPEDDFGFDDEEEADGTTGMDTVELEKLLIGIFKEADKDESGALSFNEFASLMETADLGLNKKEVQMMLAEADENSDGMVTYAEFVPLAVEIVQTMKLKQRVEMDEAFEEAEYTDMAMSIVGLLPEELEGLVLQAGEQAGDGGFLARAQVKALLRKPQLGISKQQANTAASSVEYDADDKVPAAVLAPQLYSVVIKVVVQGMRMQNLDEVGAELTRVCEFYDKEGAGFIDPRVLKQAILSTFPFLTKLQANALVSDKDAPSNAEGLVAWREYLPKLTAIIKGMGDPAAYAERSELAIRAEFQPAELMDGKDHAQMEELLANLFQEADADGNGTLDKDEFRACMRKSDFGLSPADIEDILHDFDSDGNGVISYPEFQTIAYDLLVHLARERKIMNTMGMAASQEVLM